MSASVSLAMQVAGRGRNESSPSGAVEGVRFEGRFVIWGMTGADGPLFGEDVSLFEAEQVARVGRGPQSAHLVALRSGFALEGFATGDDSFAGHMFGRSSSKTRLRIFFDESPNGTRSFEDRSTWLKGQEVAVYRAEEFFQIDPDAGIFETRVNYTLLESTPFTFNGTTVDLADIAERMSEISLGRNVGDGPGEEIPHTEAPFANRGAGTFTERFAVGGTMVAVGEGSAS